jgi:hypothetical protein
VTVRRDQVDEILPALAGLPARLVVMMQNNSLDLAHVSDIVGHDRTLFGFPASAGTAGTTVPSPTSRFRSSRRPWGGSRAGRI